MRGLLERFVSSAPAYAWRMFCFLYCVLFSSTAALHPLAHAIISTVPMGMRDDCISVWFKVVHYFVICVCVAGACEYGDELSGSIKCGEFLD